MFQQGDFTNPAELEKRRQTILRMLPQFGSAGYAGEGLAHLAQGLLGGHRLRGLDRTKAKETKRATGLFDDMIAGQIDPALDPWMTDEQRKMIGALK